METEMSIVLTKINTGLWSFFLSARETCFYGGNG